MRRRDIQPTSSDVLDLLSARPFQRHVLVIQAADELRLRGTGAGARNHALDRRTVPVLLTEAHARHRGALSQVQGLPGLISRQIHTRVHRRKR